MNDLADLIGKHRGLFPDEEKADMEGELEKAKERVRSSRALMCEALLANGIKNKKIPAISAQLEDIAGQKVDGDLVLAVLLKQARDLLP